MQPEDITISLITTASMHGITSHTMPFCMYWGMEYNMIHFFISASSSLTTVNLTGEEGVRRILVYSTGSSSSNFLYKSEIIGSFNANNNIDIDFESYYGFPKLSNFSLEITPNNSVSVIVDVVPYSDSIDDYMESREVS